MMTNGPFRIFLSSADKGITLRWKVLDGSGRVHMAGVGPMPDFAGGAGMILTLNMEIAAGEDLDSELEALPVDRAVIEQRLGKGFVSALEGDASGKETNSDQV